MCTDVCMHAWIHMHVSVLFLGNTPKFFHAVFRIVFLNIPPFFRVAAAVSVPSARGFLDTCFETCPLFDRRGPDTPTRLSSWPGGRQATPWGRRW